jgi:hypothetical protein
MIEVEDAAEARATSDFAICRIVIRRTDVPVELATHALVENRDWIEGRL